jgi:hypothetical protein
VDSIQSDKEGRAVIRLPLREDRQDYDSCQSIAEKRLESLLASKKFTAEQRSQYQAVRESYVNDGFIYDGQIYVDD